MKTTASKKDATESKKSGLILRAKRSAISRLFRRSVTQKLTFWLGRKLAGHARPDPVLGQAVTQEFVDNLVHGIGLRHARLNTVSMLGQALADLSPEATDRLIEVMAATEDSEFYRRLADALIKARPEQLAQRLLAHLPMQESYSQEGEDVVLKRIFGGKPDGFYVDVGAHHPVRFSNTYLLYRQGWRGINIDAAPDSMVEFRKHRPRDINVECLVSSTEEPQHFFIFNEQALNTASPALAQQRSHENSTYHVEREVSLPGRRLDKLLSTLLPPGQTIDFLNVDVEGADLDVLRSNDWDRYRPQYVLVEILSAATGDLEQSDIARFLHDRAYRLFAKFYNSVLFKSET